MWYFAAVSVAIVWVMYLVERRAVAQSRREARELRKELERKKK